MDYNKFNPTTRTRKPITREIPEIDRNKFTKETIPLRPSREQTIPNSETNTTKQNIQEEKKDKLSTIKEKCDMFEKIVLDDIKKQLRANIHKCCVPINNHLEIKGTVKIPTNNMNTDEIDTILANIPKFHRHLIINHSQNGIIQMFDYVFSIGSDTPTNQWQ